MPEITERNIRIPVKGEEGKHTSHKIRTIVVSQSKGIKALYCVDCKKIITYIFAKNKGWDMSSAKEWVAEHTKRIKKFETNKSEVSDKLEYFESVTAHLENEEGWTKTEDYYPNSEPFILTDEIAAFTMGFEKRPFTKEELDENNNSSNLPVEKQENAVLEDGMEIHKADQLKQIVYGVFLVPEKADRHGDVISHEDVEKVAHGFMAQFRKVDEMHQITTIPADVIESGIAWRDLDYYGKKITKGTWYGAIKIHDREVWDKVLNGTYRAFSVRITGIREPIEEA